MGKIVGATLCTHIPRLMMSEEDLKKYAHGKTTTFFEAFRQMYEERLRSLDFDTFVIFSTHWCSLIEWVIDGRERHEGLYTSDEVPHMIGGYPFTYGGDSDLARSIAREALEYKLRTWVAREKSLPYHYSTLVPMKFLNPDGRRLVLPMSVLYTSSIVNELDFGAAIGRAVEKSNRRVVLVASGGLSHKFHSYDEVLEKASPDLENIPPQNRRLDEMVIDFLKHGRHADVIDMAEQFRAQAHAEGRFAHYLRMVGALGGNSCEIKGIQYGEYEAAVGTGQVNMWFDVPH